MIGGVLYTADFYDCKISDPEYIHILFHTALQNANATMINGSGARHTFENGGMSSTVLLKESHAAIHTWPETNFVTFELFTCGETVNALTAINYLAEKLECSDYTTNRHSRFSRNATV